MNNILRKIILLKHIKIWGNNVCVNGWGNSNNINGIFIGKQQNFVTEIKDNIKNKI